jgi:hypothetical protein
MLEHDLQKPFHKPQTAFRLCTCVPSSDISYMSGVTRSRFLRIEIVFAAVRPTTIDAV